MKKIFEITTIILLLIILSNCAKDVGPIEELNPPAENISFTHDIQPIFDQNCISCHPNSGNLDLTAAHAYNQLVNINASGYSAKRVIPNEPENSVLYKKIDGSDTYGSNMPLGGALSTTQINHIKQWIIEGAQNN